MKDKIVVSIFLLLFLPVTIFADLMITVEPNRGWGNARTVDIKKLCENVALHFQEHLRDEHKINGKITIVYHPTNPKIWAFGGNEFKIGLHVTNRDWAHFSYQFGHEFCHVIQHTDEFIGNNTNPQKGWFYEGICELANLWVIKRMSKTWAYRAPYDNWVDYRHALADYVNNWMTSRSEVQYDGTGAEWLKEWENGMRDGSDFTYARASQLTYKFLPIFEETPNAWNAVRQMPTSNAPMSEYMKIWYDNIDEEDKDVVISIAEVMGIEIIDTREREFENSVALTFSYDTPDSLVPINGLQDWDGWEGGIWEKTPDGFTSHRPHVDYRNSPYMDNWDHWIYSHAPSRIIYDISDKVYTKFSSHIDMTSCAGEVSIEVIVYADNAEIYKSGTLNSDNRNTSIDFDIPRGTQKLIIEVDDLGRNACDHFVFGEPKLYYSGISPLIPEILDTDIDADVNNDGYVDLSDVLIVRNAIQNSVSYNTDVNRDGKTDEIDVLIVKAKALEAIAAAAPSKPRRKKITTWGALKRK